MFLVKWFDMLQFCCCSRSLAEMAATTSVHVVSIIELIINHASWFFPEGKTTIESCPVWNLVSFNCLDGLTPYILNEMQPQWLLRRSALEIWLMLIAEYAACYFCLLQLGNFKHGISSSLLRKEVRLEKAVVNDHVYNHKPAQIMQRSAILHPWSNVSIEHLQS